MSIIKCQSADDLGERFWRRVDKTQTGCWLWTGPTDHDGYGIVGYLIEGERFWRTHRIAYRCAVGPIPLGLVLDHLCRVRPCVNPGHLEPVTNRENMVRATSLQTHCKNGHEFSTENTYRWGTQRACRVCRRAAGRRFEIRAQAERLVQT